MKCKITECYMHDECSILDITKKQPQNSNSCSYFYTQKQIENKAKKLQSLQDELKKKK